MAKSFDKTKCPVTFMCPALLKCKKQGIYTRLGTNKCVCRDIIKDRERRKNEIHK